MKYSILFTAILHASLLISMDNRKYYKRYTQKKGLVVTVILNNHNDISTKRLFIINTIYPQDNPAKYFSKNEPNLNAKDKETIQWYREHLQKKKDEKDKKITQNGKKHLQEESQLKLPIKKRKIKRSL